LPCCPKISDRAREPSNERVRRIFILATRARLDQAQNSTQARAELSAQVFQRNSIVQRLSRLEAPSPHFASANNWLVGAAGRRASKGVSRGCFRRHKSNGFKDNASLVARRGAPTPLSSALPAPNITRAQIVRIRKRHGIKDGGSGHFCARAKRTWNKAQTMPPNPEHGKDPIQARATRPYKFACPLGSETDLGGLCRASKSPFTNPHTGHRPDLCKSTVTVWKQQHGTIPQDIVLQMPKRRFAADCEIEQWKLVRAACSPASTAKSRSQLSDAAPDALSDVSHRQVEHARATSTQLNKSTMIRRTVKKVPKQS